jgi:hypothetical protein
VPDVRVCAHHGLPLETCAITAEPDHYIALDEVTNFSRLTVSRGKLDQQVKTAEKVHALLRQSHGTGNCTGVVIPTGAFAQRPRLTDSDWLEFAREQLPGIAAKLRATYQRRIAWMTLKLALESAIHARLPIRERAPATTAFIESFVETELDAAQRLLLLRTEKEAA